MKKILFFLLFIPVVSEASYTQVGVASWYGKENSRSSTGKPLTRHLPAVAHKTLPMGSRVKITSHRTKKTVVAIVEDRGPFTRGRIVDLNVVAARKLGILKCGISKVTLEKIN
jgi:rare lipoprotein A